MGHTRRFEREDAAPRRAVKKMRSGIDKHPKNLYTEVSRIKQYSQFLDEYDDADIDDFWNEPK